MAKFEIMNNMSRKFGRMGLTLKKHSPEILVVAGVVGVVTSAVMACKATLKVNEVVEKAKSDIDTIHESVEKKVTPNGKPYNEEDSQKDLTIVYAQTGVKLIKLYGPAIALGALSVTGIVASHHILKKRNLALAAAYTVVDKGFKEYRGRVIERFGKELDKELRYNIKSKEVEEIVVDEEGNEKVVKTTVQTVNPNDISEYARFFDVGNDNWEKDAEYNLMFLRHQQNHANDLLQSRGWVLLNEVYDMLGIPQTRAGHVVGWLYNDKTSDNFIDFGIYNIHDQNKVNFVNGFEKTILLDFNVDGYIYDKIQFEDEEV